MGLKKTVQSEFHDLKISISNTLNQEFLNTSFEYLHVIEPQEHDRSSCGSFMFSTMVRFYSQVRNWVRRVGLANINDVLALEDSECE